MARKRQFKFTGGGMPEPPPQELEARFRSMKRSRLQNYIEELMFELRIAAKVLTEREAVEARIQSLSISQLEQYVLAKKTDWQLAKKLLDRKRSGNEQVGNKPVTAPPLPHASA